MTATSSPETAKRKTAPRTIDWEAIETKYRAGIISLRKIAEQHGITHAAIRQRASKEQWPRDLGAKMQAKAEEMFIKAQAPAPLPTSSIHPVQLRVVEIAGATMKADVMNGHASTLGRLRGLSRRLTDEIETQMAQRATLAEIIASADLGDGAKEAAFKTISNPGLIQQLKLTTEIEMNLLTMERKLFKLDDYRPEGEDGTRRSIPIEFIEARVIEDDEPVPVKIPGRAR